MKQLLFITIIIAILSACNCPVLKQPVDKNDYATLTTDDTLYLPFDTVKVLQKMNFRLSMNEIARLGDEDRTGLKEDWDTLELTHYMFACDCPDWVIEEEYIAHPDISFYKAPEFGFYIQAASPELDIEKQDFYLLGTKVRFIGKKYKSLELPDEYIDPGPPFGHKFRYYAYEIVKPVVLLGPLYHTGERETPSSMEEMIERTKLVVD